MAIGFFAPDTPSGLPPAVLQATPAVLRLNTGRMVDHRVFATLEEAKAWTGFEVDGEGQETYQYGWTQEQVSALDLTIPGPGWAAGFRHELVVHLARGGSLPHRTPLTGYATAILISTQGYLLSDQHLVTGPQRHHGMEERVVHPDGLPAPQLKILDAASNDLGAVRVCYVDSERDLTILKIDPPPSLAPVLLAENSPLLHDRVWQWGYPHRSHRSDAERDFLGSQGADHSLTYSPGLVVAGAGEPEWFTDADVVLGSSGSAILNDDGALVGVYRGGGAPERFPEDPFRYRRVVDVPSLGPVLAQLRTPQAAAAHDN